MSIKLDYKIRWLNCKSDLPAHLYYKADFLLKREMLFVINSQTSRFPPFSRDLKIDDAATSTTRCFYI